MILTNERFVNKFEGATWICIVLCVINVSQICQREGGLCSDMAFFQSKDNIFMVEMQVFGSLEAYAFT